MEVFKTQENLDMLTHKYMKEEFEKLLQESGNSTETFLKTKYS